MLMSKAASPIPAGFHSLTLHLNVNGAAAFMEFLKKAFDAVEIDRAPAPAASSCTPPSESAIPC